MLIFKCWVFYYKIVSCFGLFGIEIGKIYTIQRTYLSFICVNMYSTKNRWVHRDRADGAKSNITKVRWYKGGQRRSLQILSIIPDKVCSV